MWYHFELNLTEKQKEIVEDNIKVYKYYFDAYSDFVYEKGFYPEEETFYVFMKTKYLPKNPDEKFLATGGTKRTIIDAIRYARAYLKRNYIAYETRHLSRAEAKMILQWQTVKLVGKKVHIQGISELVLKDRIPAGYYSYFEIHKENSKYFLYCKSE